MLRVRLLLILSSIVFFLKNWRHFDFYEHFIKKFHIRKVKCLVRGGCQFGGWNQVTTCTITRKRGHIWNLKYCVVKYLMSTKTLWLNAVWLYVVWLDPRAGKMRPIRCSYLPEWKRQAGLELFPASFYLFPLIVCPPWLAKLFASRVCLYGLFVLI